MSEINPAQFDAWLQDDGPAALIFRRHFMPVEGKQAWIFPPTFAQGESTDDEEEGSGGVYQIDPLPDDPRHNVCLIDSVGSQANRMEPIFMRQSYAALVPQWKVEMKHGDSVSLLEVGHRAADAAVRFSKKLGPKLWNAFERVKKNRDCSELAKLAPTSLLFGVWDSRGTGVKIQRIVRSVIRAYNVKEGKRSATYQAAYDYTGNDLIGREHDKGSGKTNPLSQEGFKYSLATKTHGGIQVSGDILQEAVINLVALRTLTADLNLKRYLLGLALVALSYRDQKCFNLREGCLLCAASKEDYDGTWKCVKFDSSEEPAAINHDIALGFAQAAVQNITFDSPQPDVFDKATAEAWLAIDKKERKNLAKVLHPSVAVERKREKQAEEDLKNPADTAIKMLRAIKLGARPKEGKPRKVQPEKFGPVKQHFENLVNDASADDLLRNTAREVIRLIQEDKDSHALLDELTKKFQDLKEVQTVSTADEPAGATEGDTDQ